MFDRFVNGLDQDWSKFCEETGERSLTPGVLFLFRTYVLTKLMNSDHRDFVAMMSSGAADRFSAFLMEILMKRVSGGTLEQNTAFELLKEWLQKIVASDSAGEILEGLASDAEELGIDMGVICMMISSDPHPCQGCSELN